MELLIDVELVCGTPDEPPPRGTDGVFGYDAAGNTTTNPDRGSRAKSLTWEAEGELTAVTDTAGTGDSYTYTADGDRLVRRQGTTRTLYLPGGQELTATATGVTATRYYDLGGTTVAVRTSTGTDPYGQVTSLVPDPHGTAQLAWNNHSGELTRRYHDPYGNPHPTTRATPWAGDHAFLDKPHDTTGYVQIGARYYDPVTGRFLSVDPIMDLTDPAQWHGYAYANNNPITYTDPTGLRPQTHDGGKPAKSWYTPGYTPVVPGMGRTRGDSYGPATPSTTRPTTNSSGSDPAHAISNGTADVGLAFFREATGNGVTGGLAAGEGADPHLFYDSAGRPLAESRNLDARSVWNRRFLTSSAWSTAGRALPGLDLALVGVDGFDNYVNRYSNVRDPGQRARFTIERTAATGVSGAVVATAVFAVVMWAACPATGLSCGAAAVLTASVAAATAATVTEIQAGQAYDRANARSVNEATAQCYKPGGF